MSAANSNLLGIVELVDTDELIDAHGEMCFEMLCDEFVNRLKSWIRPVDRWRLIGNNRFCAIFNGMNSDAQLRLAAAKLERIFSEPHILIDKPVKLNIKAGFSFFDTREQDAKKALEHANRALKKARSNGSFYETYQAGSEADFVDEHELLKKVELALEEGEFQLYFQPKVHAGYRHLVGAEALMRWHTRDKKVLTPDHFMRVAESNTVIRPLTFWAIKTAAHQLSRWPDNLGIAVNIPPSLLLDEEILIVTRDVLAIRSVKPGRLTLEVTESVMAENQKLMMKQLARLRELGVRISIDDFGTGYSSLAYFRDIPADELKIDKSFVKHMLSSKKEAAIVKTIIDLAHNFSLRVVAEGVESDAMADRLSQLGCDVLQGFNFDKPLYLPDFERRYL